MRLQRLSWCSTFDGEPVPTDKVRAWYIDSTGVEAGFADEKPAASLTAVVKGGVYRIRCEYLGTPPQVRRLDKVEVARGGSQADISPPLQPKKTAGDGSPQTVSPPM